MEHSAFITQLSLFSIGVAATLGLLYLFPDLHTSMNFAWITWFAFTSMSYFMFVLGKRSAASTQRGAFINMTMFFNGLKIGVSLILVLCFIQISKPDSKHFLIPFFLIYVLFTIFEIYFLSKIAKS